LKSIRLAPAYDIVSTIIYERSTENMALSIGGVYSIYDITRESFEKEAVNVGLGRKMAMKRFDTMVEKFPEALKKAVDELKKQGFDGIEEVYEVILKRNR
jgi:serine/threonine-protein kinase HipA